MVLLVIDTQKLITNEKLYEFDTFVTNVKELINNARANNIEVIYVCHDDGEGSELTKETDGLEHGFSIIVQAYSNITVNNIFISAEQSYKYHNKFM